MSSSKLGTSLTFASLGRRKKGKKRRKKKGEGERGEGREKRVVLSFVW